MKTFRIVALVIVVLFLLVMLPTVVGIALQLTQPSGEPANKIGALLGSLIPVLVCLAIAQRLFRGIRSTR